MRSGPMFSGLRQSPVVGQRPDAREFFLAHVSDMIEQDNACQAIDMQYKTELTKLCQSMATVGMSMIYKSF